eukprot:9238361-Pyramimonas_sp.AAC.1
MRDFLTNLRRSCALAWDVLAIYADAAPSTIRSHALGFFLFFLSSCGHAEVEVAWPQCQDFLATRAVTCWQFAAWCKRTSSGIALSLTFSSRFMQHARFSKSPARPGRLGSPSRPAR